MHNPLVISVAPMMDWTDRHCRYFHRLLAPHALLYTEMVTAPAIVHGDRDRLLGFDRAEHPLALQLGGSDPAELRQAAKIASGYAYDEINLNCGCPSDRVQSGRFGACLMAEPDLVAACFEAIASEASVPVSIKCRTGIDEHGSFEFLDRFVTRIKSAGCRKFIIHARKAWLKGLSPKENREIPPLEYDKAISIKSKHPELEIHLNGGIKEVCQLNDLKQHFDGFMIGREVYQNPWFLTKIEKNVFDVPVPASREVIARAMIPYAERMAAEFGTPVKSITRHMLGLYQGQRRARAWRRVLSTESCFAGATSSVIEKALKEVLH